MGTKPDYRTILIRQWELTCTDSPKQRPSCQIVDGDFVMTIKGNRADWVEMTRAAGVPDAAQQTLDDATNTLTYRWPCHAEQIFGDGGLLAQCVPNYEMRLPQLQMARLVQRAIEMNAPALMEAGTGTGKSFAYLAVAMAMGKRVVVSTSNKALQMQLAKKDVPFLINYLYPGKQLAVAVGKGNFACRLKVEGAERQTISIDNFELRGWYQATETGNTEEIGFPVTWSDLSKITVDDDCDGKHCPLYADCFYYQSKAARQHADVIICNHKILALHMLYPTAEMLPAYDVLVVDEAHKLPDVCRDTLGFEFTQPAIDKAIALAENLTELDTYSDAVDASMAFATEVGRFLADKDGYQVGLNGTEFAYGKRLGQCLYDLAEEVWPSGALPASPAERRIAKRARRIMSMFENVTALAEPNGYVRWLEPSRRDEPLTLCAKPWDVSTFIAAFTGLESTQADQLISTPNHTCCARCQRTLTADLVAILGDRPYGPECIKRVDPFGDAEVIPLTDWLAMEHPAPDADEANDPTLKTTCPVIFTSATIAVPDGNSEPKMTAFMRECGLQDGYQLVVASPFDYAANALLYVPQGAAPAPNERGWIEWAFGELRQLVLAARGGAFLLFTSYKAMHEALHELRYTFVARGLTVLVQGEMPKLELAKRFREDGNAVLFATESFFEGVDIQGDALRLVVIDKMPFAAPNPLSQAMEAAIEAAGGNGFNDLRLPNMIIKLKQASGRLIRTKDDKGVIAILDARLRSHRYGRSRVLTAMPAAALVGRIAQVEAFYDANRTRLTPQDTVWAQYPHPVYAPAATLDADIPF